MSDGAAANVGLGDLVHLDGGHDAAVHATLFERILEGEGVDDGAQHAHVVGGDAIHVARLLRDTAEEVATAHDDGNLDTRLADLGDLCADLVNSVDIDTEAASGGEGFA